MGCVALRCAYTLERDICPCEHGRVHSGDVYCVTCITYLRPPVTNSISVQQILNVPCTRLWHLSTHHHLDQSRSFLSLLPLTQTNPDCRTVLLYFPSSRSHGCTRHSNMIEPRNIPSLMFWFLVRLDHQWCHPTPIIRVTVSTWPHVEWTLSQQERTEISVSWLWYLKMLRGS